MYELFSETRLPATSEALDKAANELTLGIPHRLYELLARTNGGKLAPDAVLRVPDGSTAGAIGLLPVEKIASVTRTVLGSGAPHTAWARDGNGSLLTVDPDGYVYFWDHDMDQEIPFECKLDGLAQHFFRREVKERTIGSPTAAGLEALLSESAPWRGSQGSYERPSRLRRRGRSCGLRLGTDEPTS